MRNVREIIRLHEQARLSQRQIARATKVSRPVVAQYLRWYSSSGLTYEQLDEFDDGELERRIEGPAKGDERRYEALRARLDYYLRELGKKGVTRQLLWQEYRREFPEGYSYTQFCFYLQAYAQSDATIAMSLKHRAGHKLFIDYAGYAPKLYDVAGGEQIDTELFVATLPASGLIYCEARMSQRLYDTVEATQNALWFYGGVPQIITPDNLRAAVTKADRYEPDINATFADMAGHYGCAVVPARAGQPTDKALVEKSVELVYTHVLAPLRDVTFTSIEQLNEAIWEKLDELNNRPMQRSRISRRERFQQSEQSELMPLPETRYTMRFFRNIKAAFNYHVYLSDDRHYYSVPYGYRGKRVRLAVTHDTVEIYYNHKRIATHRRDRTRGGYTTNTEHMSEEHRAYAEWNPERFLRWARRFGEYSEAVIAEQLERGRVPEQNYRRCMGILSLERRWPRRRVEAACRRAHHFNIGGYREIKRILEKRLDERPLETASEDHVPQHHNIRGRCYYTAGSDSAAITTQEVRN